MYRYGTVHLKKESLDGLPKSVTYNSATWAEATLQFPEWMNALEGDQPAKFHVIDDMYFISSIWKQNGRRYSGIHELLNGNQVKPNTGVNLDNFEWRVIMKMVEDINVALYGVQAKKGEKRDPSDSNVEMWSYGWFANGKEVASAPDFKQWFTEEDAKVEGEMNKPKKMKSGVKKEDLELRVTSSYLKRPAETDQMMLCLLELIHGGVDECKMSSCEACQCGVDDQQSHMIAGGCMDEEMNHHDVHFVKVKEAIQDKDLVVLYNTVCRMLGVSPQGSSMLAKAALAYLSEEDLMSMLLEDEKYFRKPGNGTKYPLAQLIRKVYLDLGMKQKIGERIYGQ